MSSPIIWDFDNISEISAIPIDKEKIGPSLGDDL